MTRTEAIAQIKAVFEDLPAEQLAARAELAQCLKQPPPEDAATRAGTAEVEGAFARFRS